MLKMRPTASDTIKSALIHRFTNRIFWAEFFFPAHRPEGVPVVGPGKVIAERKAGGCLQRQSVYR
jgi:hypothetical protein